MLFLLSTVISYFLKYDLLELLILSSFFQILSAIIALFLCKDWFIYEIPMFNYTKKLVIYSIPIAVMSLSSSLLPAIDKKFIIDYLNFTDLGLYSYNFKIASIFMVFIGVFQMAWGPFSHSIFKEEDSKQIFNTVFKFYSLIMT